MVPSQALPPSALWKEQKCSGSLQGWMSKVFTMACSLRSYQILFLVKECLPQRNAGCPETTMSLHNNGRNADKIPVTDMQGILAGYAFSDQQNSAGKVIKKLQAEDQLRKSRKLNEVSGHSETFSGCLLRKVFEGWHISMSEMKLDPVSITCKQPMKRRQISKQALFLETSPFCGNISGCFGMQVCQSRQFTAFRKDTQEFTQATADPGVQIKQITNTALCLHPGGSSIPRQANLLWGPPYLMLDSQRELGHCTWWHMTLTRGHIHDHPCEVTILTYTNRECSLLSQQLEMRRFQVSPRLQKSKALRLCFPGLREETLYVYVSSNAGLLPL